MHCIQHNNNTKVNYVASLAIVITIIINSSMFLFVVVFVFYHNGFMTHKYIQLHFSVHSSQGMCPLTATDTSIYSVSSFRYCTLRAQS